MDENNIDTIFIAIPALNEYFTDITIQDAYKKAKYPSNIFFGIFNQKTKGYKFEDFSKYPNNYIIKPNYKINTQLMIDEGFNIRRIVTSMMTKACTVSTIVKKLSSSVKSNKTRKAIVEYNKILRSIHILKTINKQEP